IDLGGRGVAERATANARRLIAAQERAKLTPAVVRATMAAGNHSPTEIAEYFEEQGFERLMVGAAVGRAHAKGPSDLSAGELAAIERESEQGLDAFLDWLDGDGPKPPGNAAEKQLARLRESLANPKRRAGVGCGVGRNMQAIAADGTITPCHRYAGE